MMAQPPRPSWMNERAHRLHRPERLQVEGPRRPASTWNDAIQEAGIHAFHGARDALILLAIIAGGLYLMGALS